MDKGKIEMTETYSPEYEKRILQDMPMGGEQEIILYPTISSLVEADRDNYRYWYAESQKETCQICGITYKKRQYSVCPLCVTKTENIRMKKQLEHLEDTLKKKDLLIKEYESCIEKDKNSKDSADGNTIKTIVTMGQYKGNPINWIVIYTDYMNERCLLLSEKVLDQIQFHDYQQMVIWENSWLRKWLNVRFYDGAFTEAEREKIRVTKVVNMANSVAGIGAGPYTKDKIYCLSASEVYGYFKKDNMRKAVGFFGTPSRWWLRTAGTKSGYATSVFSTGEIDYDGCRVANTCGVRPAMWVDISCLR